MPCRMTSRMTGILLLSALVGLHPINVQAQGVPVYDNLNFIQNVITAVQAVFILANPLLELAGLDSIETGDDLSEELETLARIKEEASGLLADVANIQRQITALFDLKTAPKSASELRKRMAEIRHYLFKVYVDAIRTQSLM